MDKSKEQRYEELVNAVAGGELAMVKFLWNLVSEIEELVGKTPQSQIEKRGKKVDQLIKKIQPVLDRVEKNPIKDGKTPSRQELELLIKPLIPRPIPGDPGEGPSEEYLLDLIESIMPDPVPGPPPSEKQIIKLIKKLLPKQKKTSIGGIPKHEWNGTFIRFQLPNGEWGEYKNLQGSPGPESFGGPAPAASMQIPVKAGTGVEIHKDASGAQVISSTGTGSGSGNGNGNATTIEYETPTGTVDDSNVTFNVTRAPLYLVVNGVQYFEDQGYSRSGTVITLDNAIGSGGFIRSAFVSSGVETPTGTVNDANTAFTVVNTPLFVVVNGQKLFEGAGYSLSGSTITLDNPIGSGGFIRSVYEDGANNETPTGTVDDSNLSFVVDNEPRYLVINGLLYFAGAGYTYSDGDIDLDNAVGDNGFIRSVY